VAHPYATFSEPSDPDARPGWRYLMHCARQFRDAVESCAPEGRNKTEALQRLDKAVMVATGAFHVRPKETT
jgi:hypothetical protein